MYPVLGAILRTVGGKAAQWAAKKMSKEGLKKEAAKKTATGAAGLGVTSATPAHAPGTSQPPAAPKESSSISPEASKPPAAPSSTPNFSNSFGP